MYSIGTVKPERALWKLENGRGSGSHRQACPRDDQMTHGWQHQLQPCSLTSCIGETCCTLPGLRPVCSCLNSNPSVSDVIQETSDWLITDYYKLIIGFKKCQFHNLTFRLYLSEWNLIDWWTYECVQLVLSASSTETSVYHSGYTIITVYQLCHWKCVSAWYTKLPRPTTGKY